MTTRSGTFTAAGETSLTFFLRATETARVVLTITGSATITLDEIVGSTVVRTRETFTASTTGFDYVNTTPTAKVLQLRAQAVSGSVAYSLADVIGDQVLQEWRAADGTVVARMKDTGLEEYVGGEDTDNVIYAAAHGVVAGTGADMSANIAAAEAAAGAGVAIIFPPGEIVANNVATTVARRSWISQGFTRIIKGASGDLHTVSGEYFYAKNIEWRGESATPAFTGSNLVLTGDYPCLDNCGSIYAYDHALLATGNRVRVRGSRSVWHTTNAHGRAIEVGLSGVATLYHDLADIYTSDAAIGVAFIDCGEFTFQGGQIGPLSILKGTGPSGSGAGKVDSVRILGDVTVELSNGTIDGCHFGANSDIAYAADTSGNVFGLGNMLPATATITNNGNANNTIFRVLQSPDAPTGHARVRLGPDTSTAYIDFVTSGSVVGFPSIRVANNLSVLFRNAADSDDGARITLSDSNNLQIVNLTSAAAIQMLATLGKVQLGTVGAGVRSAVSINGLELLSLTTAQRDALSSVEEGTVIFNDDTNKLNFYTGAAWEAVTSA